MTGTNFASLIRLYTRTNSTTLTNSDIVLMANTVKDDFVKEIAKRDEDIFFGDSTQNLVASSSSRKYTLSAGYPIRIKRVEAKFDGTNWVKLEEKDLSQFRDAIGNETFITSQFENTAGHAFYELSGRAINIYSGTVTAVTSGLRVWAIIWPADITSSTLSSSADLSEDASSINGMPREFHELWARKVAIMWKSTRDKPIPLMERELVFEQDFEKALDAITNSNLDRNTTAKIPSDIYLQY